MKNPFGLKNGKLITIEEITESGLACECYCPDPNCNARLVAKHYKNRIDHFAHENESENCNGYETALHLAGKEIILKHKKLLIPKLEIDLDLIEEATLIGDTFNYQFEGFYEESPYINTIISEERIIEFDKILIEKRYNDFIPDLTLIKGEKKLLVEIVVSNDIDITKYEKIKSSNVSVLRIDLREYERDCNNQIENEILYNPSNRNWVFNSVKEDLKEKLKKEKLNILTKLIEEESTFLNNQDDLVWNYLIKKEKDIKLIEEFKTYIIPRYSKEHGRVEHIDPCPLKEEWNSITYANVELDCISCPYFNGFLNNKTSILCLGNYFTNNKRKRNKTTTKRNEINDYITHKYDYYIDDDMLED